MTASNLSPFSLISTRASPLNCILIKEAQAMDPSNVQKQHQAEEPRLLDFPHLPDHATQDGAPRLNKYSSTITRDHDFPGAQVRHLLPPQSRLFV